MIIEYIMCCILACSSQSCICVVLCTSFYNNTKTVGYGYVFDRHTVIPWDTTPVRQGSLPLNWALDVYHLVPAHLLKILGTMWFSAPESVEITFNAPLS